MSLSVCNKKNKVKRLGYVGDGGTDKPHRVRGAARVPVGAMGGGGLTRA